MDYEDEEEVSPANWWMFFPFSGLQITDSRHDLRKPIFGDFTLLPARNIPSVIRLLKLEEPEHSRKHIDNLVKSALMIAEADNVRTFLAVRRRGILPEDDMINDEYPPLIHEMRERAYEVAAVLAVVMLTQSQYHTTCGLAEQIHQRPDNLALFDIEQGGYWVQSGGKAPISFFSAEIDEAMTREQIKRVLFKKPFRALSEVSLTKTSKLGKSLRRAVQQATLRLADAIHSPSLSSQLLGAVTTLEILFALDDSEKYDVRRQRIIALLGTAAAGQYPIQGILDARHRYVHDGLEVREDELSWQAIYLALSCLLHYGEAVASFNDKPQFIRYLDVIYKAEQIAPTWNEAEQRAFKRLLRHKCEPIKLPFRTLH